MALLAGMTGVTDEGFGGKHLGAELMHWAIGLLSVVLLITDELAPPQIWATIFLL